MSLCISQLFTESYSELVKKAMKPFILYLSVDRYILKIGSSPKDWTPAIPDLKTVHLSLRR